MNYRDVAVRAVGVLVLFNGIHDIIMVSGDGVKPGVVVLGIGAFLIVKGAWWQPSEAQESEA